MRVLDVGCGSALLPPRLGAVDYVGIDLNPRHIEEARRLRAVAIDPAFVRGQHPVARLLARLDSGQNVRAPAGYSTPFARRFRSVDEIVRHDLLRIPYTHCIVIAADPR